MQWLEVGELPPEDLDTVARTMAFHLRKLVEERDESSEVSKLTFSVKLSTVFYLLYVGKGQVKDHDEFLHETDLMYLFSVVDLGADSRERLLAVAATP